MAEKLDQPCIVLCKAINSLYGLHTTNSCCGHGKESYQIRILADHPNFLYPIAKCIDFTVVKTWGWSLTVVPIEYVPKSFEMVDFTKQLNLKVGYLLDSGINKGKKAYTQACRIATALKKGCMIYGRKTGPD